MKMILNKVYLLIVMLVFANQAFSQKIKNYDEDLLFLTMYLGFGEESFNNNSKGSVFSMDISGGNGRFGGSFDMNITSSPTLNPQTKNYIDLENCQIWDFKLLMHYYPFKVRKIFNPYIEAGPGYSYLERVGETSVTYNNPLYNQTVRDKIGQYFIIQCGAGLTVFIGKYLAIKAEYTESFFRNPNYLNGGQYVVKIGINNFLD